MTKTPEKTTEVEYEAIDLTADEQKAYDAMTPDGKKAYAAMSASDQKAALASYHAPSGSNPAKSSGEAMDDHQKAYDTMTPTERKKVQAMPEDQQKAALEKHAKKTKAPPPLTKEQRDNDLRYAIHQVQEMPKYGDAIATALMMIAGDLTPAKEVVVPKYVLDDRGWRYEVEKTDEIHDQYGRMLKSKTKKLDRHADWDSAVAVPNAVDNGEAPVGGKAWVIKPETKVADPKAEKA
jgi:hypothetical protein